MPGEDQERFEDYLELERFIAELQAGHVAHPPQELTPTQARVYRMATLFHAATPDVGEPEAEFAAQLRARLENELQSLPGAPQTTQAHSASPLSARKQVKRRVSRRLLLTGGATAAASMAVGAGLDHMMAQAAENGSAPQGSVSQGITVKVSSPTNWFPVTTVAEMGTQAVKFRAEGTNGTLCLTGYVVRSDGTNGNSAEKGKVIAMSAACTHMGCIVQWSNTDRRFHCPCHGGVFAEDGGIDEGSSSLYLNPLPRLDVKVDDDGKIYVRMPTSSA